MPSSDPATRPVIRSTLFVVLAALVLNCRSARRSADADAGERPSTPPVADAATSTPDAASPDGIELHRVYAFHGGNRFVQTSEYEFVAIDFSIRGYGTKYAYPACFDATRDFRYDGALWNVVLSPDGQPLDRFTDRLHQRNPAGARFATICAVPRGTKRLSFRLNLDQPHPDGISALSKIVDVAPDGPTWPPLRQLRFERWQKLDSDSFVVLTRAENLLRGESPAMVVQKRISIHQFATAEAMPSIPVDATGTKLDTSEREPRYYLTEHRSLDRFFAKPEYSCKEDGFCPLPPERRWPISKELRDAIDEARTLNLMLGPGRLEAEREFQNGGPEALAKWKAQSR